MTAVKRGTDGRETCSVRTHLEMFSYLSEAITQKTIKDAFSQLHSPPTKPSRLHRVYQFSFTQDTAKDASPRVQNPVVNPAPNVVCRPSERSSSTSGKRKQFLVMFLTFVCSQVSELGVHLLCALPARPLGSDMSPKQHQAFC